MDHILITGGTHGIGRATVELLLQMGTRVSTCARNSDELTQLKAQTASDNLHITTCDIKSDSDCTRFVDEAFNRFGSISGLVNNAGEVCVGRLDSASPEDLLSYFDLKVARSLRLVQLVLPKASPNGISIVNVAGAAGVDPTALLGIAGIANAALRNLSRMLADELAEKKAQLNTVNPGTLNTRLSEAVLHRFAEELGVAPELVRDEMYGSLPLGRIPSAHDIAESIAFFLSTKSAMITGAELTPDGGTLIRRLRG